MKDNKPFYVLWHSNGTGMPTGYGNQTRIWTPRVKDQGYGIAISAYRGIEGAPIVNKWGILELPRARDPNCNDIIVAHMRYVQADMVWSLLDPFVMDAQVWGALPWASWTPIDCEPVLPHEMTQLRACRWPIAMSRHGEEQMRAVGLKPLYVPHGIETDVFVPTDRARARRNVEGLARKAIPDDGFLVIVVAANGEGWPSRKNFTGMLEAFAVFAREHPDALLYIHSESEGVWRGEPLREMVKVMGIADKVLFPSEYLMVAGMLGDAHLNDVYNAGDVLMNLSRGEGFGLTAVESQSAGCPVITTAFSASLELNFTGWKVSGPLISFVPGTKQMIPDAEQAAACLEQAWQIWQKGDMPSLRARTREATLCYDVQQVMRDYMIPALETIRHELREGIDRRAQQPKLSRQQRRRQERKKERVP